MSTAARYTLRLTGEGLLNSYSQIFFSLDKRFGILLLCCSFIDPSVGISALLAGIAAILMACFLGFDHKNIREGLYSFNSVMVGMVMAVYYDLNLPFFVLLLFMSVFTLFVTLALNARFQRHALPIMSIPFLFGVWTVLLVGREFAGLHLTVRGIYTINDILFIGGETLFKLYELVESIPLPDVFDLYLRSLGAIFFQYNLLAGFIIMFGLLYFSRIAFLLSLVGFFSGYVFYGFMEGEFAHLHYSYIGFNFILSAIALGGFFIIPSAGSFLLVALASPVIAVLISAFSGLFAVFQLPIYSLPYNVLVLLTLFVLRLRLVPKGLNPVTDQTYSPETNLYRFLNQQERYANETLFHIYLPILGQWTVSQGHEGEITHKGDWKEAFDLVIEDERGKTYRDPGIALEDYYAYNRPIIAPQDGWVVAVQNEVEDNAIGQVNLKQNWGNTIVLKHGEGMYTKLSHLRKGSVKVALGDTVRKGQTLAMLGNSGRSPEPHLHFQMQATPHIGSKTMKYPLAYYMEQTDGGERLHAFDYPKKGQTISNVQIEPLLKTAFDLIPGMRITLSSGSDQFECEVFTDAYNLTYLFCHRTEAMAYFVNNGTMFYFTRYIGKQDTPLFDLYTGAYKVLLGFYSNVCIEDRFPLNEMYSGMLKGALDLVSPFYSLVQANYRLDYDKMDDALQPEWLVCSSTLEVVALGGVRKRKQFRLTLDGNGLSKFVVIVDGAEKTWSCRIS